METAMNDSSNVIRAMIQRIDVKRIEVGRNIKNMQFSLACPPHNDANVNVALKIVALKQELQLLDHVRKNYSKDLVDAELEECIGMLAKLKL